jgi:hypothetical protein
MSCVRRGSQPRNSARNPSPAAVALHDSAVYSPVGATATRLTARPAEIGSCRGGDPADPQGLSTPASEGWGPLGGHQRPEGAQAGVLRREGVVTAPLTT